MKVDDDRAMCCLLSLFALLDSLFLLSAVKLCLCIVLWLVVACLCIVCRGNLKSLGIVTWMVGGLLLLKVCAPHCWLLWHFCFFYFQMWPNRFRFHHFSNRGTELSTFNLATAVFFLCSDEWRRGRGRNAAMDDIGEAGAGICGYRRVRIYMV